MGAFMCANFVAVVLLSWMPKFLYDKFHMSLAMAGLTATIFVQLASMAGAPVGGWLADKWRRRSPRGRVAVQMIGVLGGAPFVALCGLTPSVGTVMLALTAWGFFKGLYDANIFASVFDVVRPEARGTAAGIHERCRLARRWRQRAARDWAHRAEAEPRAGNRARVHCLHRRGSAPARSACCSSCGATLPGCWPILHRRAGRDASADTRAGYALTTATARASRRSAAATLAATG